MTETAKYYKELVPQAASNPVPYGAELVAEEYMGFLMSRVGSENTLWHCETKEGGLPPLDLQGQFTTKGKLATHIANWWIAENKKVK